MTTGATAEQAYRGQVIENVATQLDVILNKYGVEVDERRQCTFYAVAGELMIREGMTARQVYVTYGDQGWTLDPEAGVAAHHSPGRHHGCGPSHHRAGTSSLNFLSESVGLYADHHLGIVEWQSPRRLSQRLRRGARLLLEETKATFLGPGRLSE